MSVKLLCILALSACCFGQTQGFRAALLQSNVSDNGFLNCGTNGGNSQVVPYCNNVVSGNLLVGLANWKTTGQTLSVSDTQSNSWTNGTQIVCDPGAITGGTAVFQLAWTTAGSSAADSVTFSGITQHNQSVAEFTNAPTTADGTTQSTCTTSSATSLSVSATTAVDGDLCVIATGNWVATSNMNAQPPLSFGSGTGGTLVSLIESQTMGAAGTYSFTVNSNPYLGSPAWGVAVQCFKPSATAVTVVTSALPHAADGTAYRACLQAVGGVGNYTWTATAGKPGWATVNSTDASCPTGDGSITGTPIGTGTVSVTLQASDGTHSGSRALNLGTGASFGTPTLSQSVGFATSPLTFSSNVPAGDVVLVLAWGKETRGSDNAIPETNGTSDSVVDNGGNTYFRVDPSVQVMGNNSGANGAAPLIFAACNSSTKALTVTATFSGAAPPIALLDMASVQSVIDDGSGGTGAGYNANPISLTTQNYTARVPNMFLLGVGSEGVKNTPAISSPFTQLFSTIDGSVDLLAGYQQVTSATTYTATMTATSTDLNSDVLALQLIGLRPEISGLACSANPPSAPSGFSHADVL